MSVFFVCPLRMPFLDAARQPMAMRHMTISAAGIRSIRLGIGRLRASEAEYCFWK